MSGEHLADTPLLTKCFKPTPTAPAHLSPSTNTLTHAAMAALTPVTGVSLILAMGPATPAHALNGEPVVNATAGSVTPDDEAGFDLARAIHQAQGQSTSRSEVRHGPWPHRRHHHHGHHHAPSANPATRKPITQKVPTRVISLPQHPKSAAHKPPIVHKPVVHRHVGHKPAHALNPPGGTLGARVVALARTQLGLPYRYGTESPGRSFDCSGLTQWVYGRFGHYLPRSANAQYHATHATSTPSLGDLVFFLSGGAAYHVGIFLGHGMMLAAPHSGDHVKIEQIYGRNWVVHRVA